MTGKSASVLFSDLKQCGTIKGKTLFVRYGHIQKQGKSHEQSARSEWSSDVFENLNSN